MNKQGFILIIVIGILGTLSLVAMQLASTSRTSAQLQETDLRTVEARLIARSGIERGLKSLDQALLTDLVDPVMRRLGHLNLSLPVGFASIDITDSSGAINVNDGIRAGLLELGPAYAAEAIDPRPETTPGSGVYVENVSGLINLRLRRLLNAFGDVHRFVAQHGWPVWKRSEFTGAAPYGQAFNHSCTAVGNRHESMPGRDLVGMTVMPADTASTSTGLGDRVIATRPSTGYADVEDIRSTVNGWAAAMSIDPAHWLDRSCASFFDLVSGDLTTRSAHDESFHRLTREPGPDLDGDGFVDYNDDQTDPLVETLALDTDPPDLTDLWRRHPVALININSCSDYTRAAVFHAPTNVSLTCEGVQVFRNRDDGKARGFDDQIPTLGVGGPVFHASRLVDNGNPSRQQGRLLSLRDSMALAQAYSAFPDEAPGESLPEGFSGFTRFLRSVTDDTQAFAVVDNESAHPGSTYDRYGRSVTKTSGTKYHAGNAPTPWFDENYVHRILPHILSTSRRLPGWLHAPVALLSPVVQHGSRGGSPDRVARSAEDFVVRCTHPKVTFLPDGTFEITSLGTAVQGARRSTARIRATFRLFSTGMLSSQQDFVDVDDGSSDTAIRLGPEPHIPNVNTTPMADPVLGFIGLNDRQETTNGLGSAWTHMARMTFDPEDPFRVDASGGASFPPQDPVMDAFLAPDQNALLGSGLEGFTSMFQSGSAGSDISPFGGISLGNLGHGARATDLFADSLYWRPYGTGGMLGAADTAGSVFGKGMISMWVRIPSGYLRERHVPLFQMTLWERVEIARNNYMAPPGTVFSAIEPPVLSPKLVVDEVRPVTITVDLEMGEPYEIGPPNWFESVIFPTRFVLNHSRGRQQIFGQPTSGNATMSTPDWDGDKALPSQLYPVDGSPLPADVLGNQYPSRPPSSFMGFSSPEFPQTVDATTEWPYLFMKPPGNSMIHPANAVTVKEDARSLWQIPGGFTRRPGDNGMCTPGTWQRVICAWDLGSFPANLNERLWISVPTAAETYSDSNNSWILSQIVTRNPKMALTLGESHVRWKEVATPLKTYTTEPTDEQFIPVHRLNSLVDDIDIRFGSTGPFNSQADLDGIDTDPALSGFRTKRYDLTTESEPAAGGPGAETISFVIDPALPAGSELIALGGRIYDVPDLNLADQDRYNAPRIDITAWSGTSEITPAWQTPVRRFQSPELRTYAGDFTDTTTRFRVTWHSVDPGGNLLKDNLANIGYVESVYWAYRDPGGITVITWKNN